MSKDVKPTEKPTWQGQASADADREQRQRLNAEFKAGNRLEEEFKKKQAEKKS